MEEDWSNSKDEDGDNSFLPDALEITQLREDDEQLLNDSDIQSEITSDTEVSTDTENLDGDTQGNTKTVSQSESQTCRTDSHPDASHPSSSLTTIPPFTPPLFMSQLQPRPHHNLPSTTTVEDYFPSNLWGKFLPDTCRAMQSVCQTTTAGSVIQLGRHHGERDKTLHGNPSGSWGIYASMCEGLPVMASS